MHQTPRVSSLLVPMLLLLWASWLAPLRAEEIKQATVYPTSGYRIGFQWVIPMRIWVHEPRQITEAVVTRLVARLGSALHRRSSAFATGYPIWSLTTSPASGSS